MKLTPLKRKTPLKSSKSFKTAKDTTSVKKHGKRAILGRTKRVKSEAKLKKELWKWFSMYIRKRDKNICFTCGVYAEGSGYHAGHFVPKSVGGLALYFHEDNVHGQCYRCNINLGGNQYEYGKRLGDMAEYLYSLKNTTTKWSELDYMDKIEKYKNLAQM